MSHFYIKQVGQEEIDLTQRLPSLIYLDGLFTPNFTNTYQENVGTDGSQLTSVAFGKATFVANFFMPATDYHEHQLMRHEFIGNLLKDHCYVYGQAMIQISVFMVDQLIFR
ncbi:Uncharacterised protein [Weissella viridescens]|uniref:Siphovirus-type tail component RIFT-related domain-containing protein n=1 Tax=Weissella viridescens TaxID=1629 RepID=A0A380P8B2_WEIVI|nr:Uncharacterised protein [Weissella viridescens]